MLWQSTKCFINFLKTGFFGSYSWFSPKKLFTNLIRETLFTFFRIETLKIEKNSQTKRLYHSSPTRNGIGFPVGFRRWAL